jgi:hypothetical protein
MDQSLKNFRFAACRLGGHIFFMLTIVKSFSKEELPPRDATNSPHILDEFDQQSPGL